MVHVITPSITLASTFGMDTPTWDHQSWNDSVTFDASGTTLTGTGGAGFFTNRYSSHDSWNTDRTVTATSVPGVSEAVDTGSFSTNYTSDVTVSDVQANLSTGATTYDTNGTPTDQFANPVGGTTFLSRAFITSTTCGSSTTTTSGLDLEEPTSSHYVAGSGNSASRLFVDTSQTIGDRNERLRQGCQDLDQASFPP